MPNTPDETNIRKTLRLSCLTLTEMIPKVRALGMTLSLLQFSCCATPLQLPAIAPARESPAEVTINKSAGRGGNLFVSLRLANGEELPFAIDTGSEGTIFDTSLEPQLGKSLGTVTLSGPRGKTQSELYAAPDLYLGKVRLMMGSEVATRDFKEQSEVTGHRVMGILGMDCLKHYCIQLDFEAGKMRFLSFGQVAAAKLGKAFPLTFRNNCPYIRHASFAGGKTSWSLIDSGCVLDGFIEQEMVKGTNAEMPLLECMWAGETCTNLFVATGGNVVGLRFLARHLVTLDFPNRAMYLRQTSIGPLVDNDVESAMIFLKELKKNGGLPGWSKTELGETAYPEANFNSVTISARKKGDLSVFHYTLVRPSKISPWELHRAWRTDEKGRIKELPVP